MSVEEKPIYSLTDSPRKRHKLAREERLRQVKEKLHHRAKMRTDQAKIDTVRTYLALGGNKSLTAASMGLHRNTLINWSHTDWWKKLLQEFRNEQKFQVSARAKVILQRSLEQLQDRLENGDVYIHPKTGEIQRKPVSAKELNVIANDMAERADKLDKSIDGMIEEEKTQEKDKLEKIAEQLANLAVKAVKKKQINVTDVIYVNDEGE